MVVNYKLTNIEWKENTDLPTELDLPESCLDKEGHPDMELILYWLEDEIGYACDGFEIVEIENRISKVFGHLLSWKYYGDLPCVRIGNTIHITENAFRCVCGQSWSYGRPTERESLHNNNIIWRDISAVSCEKCRSSYKKGIKTWKN